MTVTPKKVLGWSALILLALLLIARLSTSPILKSGFSNFFAQHGVEASIGDIELDLIDSRLSLRAVTADKDSSRVLQLREINLDWSWQPLFDNQAIIESFSIDGLTLITSKLKDGAMVVAGLNLNELASSDESSEYETSSDDENEPINWRTALRGLGIEDTRICYKDETNQKLDYCINLGELSWNGDIGFDLAQLDADALPLALDGELVLSALDIHNNALQRSLLSWSSLNLNSISSKDLADLKITNITLTELKAMQRTDEEPVSVTSLSALDLHKLSLSDINTLNIDQITITDHQLYINKLDDGSLELASWLPAGSADEKADDQQAGAKHADPFHVSIGEITYQSTADIVYEDHSMPDTFRIALSDTELSLKDFDTQQTEQAMQLVYRTTVDGHGRIELTGELTPLADKRSFDIEGIIKGLDLRNVSAFTKGTIGYSIKSGQLDSDMDIKADKNQLDSKLGLQLHQFMLKPLSKEDEEKLNSSMGLPLSTSLSLLRDRDNSIRLEIPITGDLDNPDFDPADVINKATSKAITVAVLNYYTPLGLVLAADGLLNLATALKFEPVTFSPTAKELDSQAVDQLKKTLTLLKERPGVRLTLCGYTTTADNQVLHPDLKPGKDGKPAALSDTQKQALSDMGEARAAVVKQHLVDQGIAADRLVLCAPEHEESDQTGRVELSI